MLNDALTAIATNPNLFDIPNAVVKNYFSYISLFNSSFLVPNIFKVYQLNEYTINSFSFDYILFSSSKICSVLLWTWLNEFNYSTLVFFIGYNCFSICS